MTYAIGRSATAAALVLALASGSGAITPPARGQTPRRPNVLIVITDDQRADRPLANMPNAQQIFGAEGVRFNRAFSNTPLCCPARASLMTGRYAHNHRVREFTPYKLDQTTTLQHYLEGAGYRTAFFGKYLNGWKLSDNPPDFRRWAVFPQSTGSTYVGGRWNVDGVVQTIDRYSTHYMTDRGVGFLERSETKDRRPWLLYLSTPAAHSPFIAEERYANAPVSEWGGNPAVFEEDLSDKPRYVREFARGWCDLACGSETRAAQLRTLPSIDDMIGTIFSTMKRLDEDTSTLSVLVSDNGVMWGEHGLPPRKRVPYTQAISIPLFARWPRRLEPHSDRRLTGLIDVAPTVLSAAGIAQDPSTPMDGSSLLDGQWRPSILLESWGGGIPRWASIRSRGFQYIEYYDRSGTGFKEYYDLRTDPWQLTNLLRDGDPSTGPNRAEKRELSSRLLGYRRCAGSTCP